jgi:hypothetical protein
MLSRTLKDNSNEKLKKWPNDKKANITVWKSSLLSDESKTQKLTENTLCSTEERDWKIKFDKIKNYWIKSLSKFGKINGECG